MDEKKFTIMDNQPIIRSIKKRATIKAIAIFVGLNLLSAFIFQGGFYILIPFLALWSFGIYSNTKQRLLHQQFPDKFEQPKLKESNHHFRPNVSIDANASRGISTNPYDAKSTLFSSLNYTSIRKDT